MITIIDSGICNTLSIATALDSIGARYSVTSDAAQVGDASGLLVPCVGAFADGMAALNRHSLVGPIRAHVLAGKPLLGICLGMQLLVDESEEFGLHSGLGLIPGRVHKLPSSPDLRVPNIGWCDVRVTPTARLFSGIEKARTFYFVHSYVVSCVDPIHSVGTIDFGSQEVTVACQRGNVFGAQFHPEKSQDNGLAFLKNFSTLTMST